MAKAMAKLFDHLRGFVRRSVVGDDDFYLRRRLNRDAFQHFPQTLCAVSRRNADGKKLAGIHGRGMLDRDICSEERSYPKNFSSTWTLIET